MTSHASTSIMKVVINKSTPVGVWVWPNLSDAEDVCGICRAEFETPCPICWKPGASCPPVTGACSHAFHKHCIEKWVSTYSSEHTCPMCRQVFHVKNAAEQTNEWETSDSGVQSVSMDRSMGRDMSSIWNSDSVSGM